LRTGKDEGNIGGLRYCLEIPAGIDRECDSIRLGSGQRPLPKGAGHRQSNQPGVVADKIRTIENDLEKLTGIRSRDEVADPA